MTVLQRSLRNCAGSLCLALALASGADWDAAKAAQYLDGRMKDWFAWPRANEYGAPCVACHTSVPYLLARPALRRALAESSKTPYETGLLAGIRSQASKHEPRDLLPGYKGKFADQLFGAQIVLAALLFAREEARQGGMSPEAEMAFERMWDAQLRSGAAKGAWAWLDVKLDPWEDVDAAYFGAAIAALATGIAPGDYQSRPNIVGNIEPLKEYLRAGAKAQPLHNRLALAWASTRLRSLLTVDERKAIIEEAMARQQPDGGWTLESLGPWQKHPNAPPQPGSNSYATAFTAFVLRQMGAPSPRAAKWLQGHQDASSGAWPAESMNKVYEPGSMMLSFMRDAATGYAVLALLGE